MLWYDQLALLWKYFLKTIKFKFEDIFSKFIHWPMILTVTLSLTEIIKLLRACLITTYLNTPERLWVFWHESLFLYLRRLSTSHEELLPESSFLLPWLQTYSKNKKVLLRERNRHTIHRVASARSAAAAVFWRGGGVPPHPVPTGGGGSRGVPPSSSEGGVPHTDLTGVPPPPPSGWMGVLPVGTGWGLLPPIQLWQGGWGYPSPVGGWGYPPPPGVDWHTNWKYYLLPSFGWGGL